MRYLPVPKFRRLQWLPRRRWSRRKGLNGVQVDPFDSTREFCLKAVAWGALQLATNIPANIKWRSLFEAGTEREGRLGKEGGSTRRHPENYGIATFWQSVSLPSVPFARRKLEAPQSGSSHGPGEMPAIARSY